MESNPKLVLDFPLADVICFAISKIVSLDISQKQRFWPVYLYPLYVLYFFFPENEITIQIVNINDSNSMILLDSVENFLKELILFLEENQLNNL